MALSANLALQLRLLQKEVHAFVGLQAHVLRVGQRGSFVHVTEQLLHAGDVQHEIPLRPLGRPHIQFAQDALAGDGVPVELLHGAPADVARAESRGGWWRWRRRRRWWRRWWYSNGTHLGRHGRRRLQIRIVPSTR